MNQKSGQPPIGRLKAKHRTFEEVVRDMRYIVFAVVRHRPVPGGGFAATALGSGFFVSPGVFLTCHHVVSNAAGPHNDGDTYHLVANLPGALTAVHIIRGAILGQTIHLFPDSDLAFLIADDNRNQPYAALSYEDIREGKEIGVAGYPLPTLIVTQGTLRYDGLIFRVAKGVVTATYETNMNPDQGTSLLSVPVIEVNFLFVPGNSGGPIFDSETGRALGFVAGYRTEKIRERVEEATLIKDLPPTMSRSYIENLNALYSLGIKLNRVRDHLEKFSISL